ncbi:hypothetical protein HPHPP3_1128 [Helicobacter pylori Hp P-3]|uniref:hypothetical protein n=1 Tax=Helicobacter pylori TaxID=210 RepID=UPI00026AC99F|nr:hypothetical protein HPHPP3_1128 [Helicobacter pylori Hp P-3]
MKIKLTLKTPLKTPYQGNKVTTTRVLFYKKKNGILGGLALNFWGFFLKTLFGISKFFNVKSR